MKVNQQRSQPSQNQDEEALLLFNQIKDTYSEKIEELNDLKKQIFQSDQIDQQQRSKLRISIESLLIDLNEEIFSISEELAKSFTFERQKNLFQKAQEFDHRKNALMRKIKETIDQNQSVKIIRRHSKISQMSPPQRDLNTFGLQTQESDRWHQNNTIGVTNTTTNAQLRLSAQKQIASPNPQLRRNFSSQKMTNQNEAFQTDTSIGYAQRQRNSLKKKKSPIPLRRKDDQTAQSYIQESRNFSNSSRKNMQQNSSKKQLFPNDNSKDTKRDQKLKRNIKKLEEFEKYLSRKNGTNTAASNQLLSANKENKKPTTTTSDEQSQFSTVQLQSEAFETFSQEFAHMKTKMMQMQNRLNGQEEKTKSLEDLVEKLKTENLKLSTDVKIIRNEHSEILHSLFNLEKKNSQLQQENHALKRMVAGEKELKAQETNLPKPYLEKDQSLQQDTQQIDQRKQSPFSSFLHKNRSFSNLRESKDSAASMNNNNDIANNTQRNFNFKVSNNPDFMSFQPSLNQTYKVAADSRERGIEGQTQDLNNYNNVRSSLRNLPSFHQNPLLSVSNDRGTSSNINNSFLQQPQTITNNNVSRVISGPSSRRGDIGLYSRGGGGIDDTPKTPDHLIGQVTEDTPNQNLNRMEEPGGRQRQYNIGTNNKKLTPTSSSQHMALLMGNTSMANDQNNLSDWVLERLNKKQ